MSIRLNGSTSGYTEIDAPATAGSNSITLPSGNGSANQFLKNGSTAGTLGWSSMVEDSSGRLLVGTSSTSTIGMVQVAGNSAFGSTSTGVFDIKQGSNAASGDNIARIEFSDARGPFARIGCDADATTGTNDYPGRLVFSTTADGASSPTERMRISSDASTRIGMDNFGDASVQDNINNGGLVIKSSSGAFAQIATPGGGVLAVNRLTNDGTLISLRQAGIEEGSISVSGTTVSYNGAHLSRWSQLSGIDPYDKTVRPEILRGTVMSNLDEMCDWTCPTSGDCQDNEQLNKTKISDVEGDKNVAGVFQSWDDDDDTWVNDFYLAMTGDFVIRIAAGATVQRGDLLMSAGDGTAKPQDDDIIRSKTVAKVTSTNVSCTYEDGSYCVPCVLMAC